jgi:hypothetical protein
MSIYGANIEAHAYILYAEHLVSRILPLRVRREKPLQREKRTWMR